MEKIKGTKHTYELVEGNCGDCIFYDGKKCNTKEFEQEFPDTDCITEFGDNNVLVGVK